MHFFYFYESHFCISRLFPFFPLFLHRNLLMKVDAVTYIIIIYTLFLGRSNW